MPEGSIDLTLSVAVAGEEVVFEKVSVPLPFRGASTGQLSSLVRTAVMRAAPRLTVDVSRLEARVNAIYEAEDAETEDAERSGAE